MDKKFLFEMLKTMSVSGDEFTLTSKIIKYGNEIFEKVETDHVGNVVMSINNQSPYKIMLFGHMDEIGLVVSKILNDGRAKVAGVGSITPYIYVGQRVRISTKKGIIFGVIAKIKKDTTYIDEDLILDIGSFSYEETSKLISIGDKVVLDHDYVELNKNILAARALDDKIGVITLIEVLRNLKDKIDCGVYGCASVGEETTKNGALFSARKIKPNIAIAIDVTSDTTTLSGVSSNSSEVKLNNGPTLTIGTTMNKVLTNLIIKIAKENNINLQTNYCIYRTYTDADAVHYIDTGIPTILLSIPLRYMHGAGELISYNDVEDLIKLLTLFITEISRNKITNFNCHE